MFVIDVYILAILGVCVCADTFETHVNGDDDGEDGVQCRVVHCAILALALN